MKNVSYDVSVRLQVWFRRDGREWLVWCPGIDVMSQARTKRQALEMLREAVGLWFESCIDRGVLDKALEECGFSKVSTEKVAEEADSTCDQVSIKMTQTRSQPVVTPVIQLSLSHYKGTDLIDGTIPVPAYIAASKMRDGAFARG